MLDKALGLAPDVYVPDMEDSVPVSEKANARHTIASYLPRLADAGPAVLPRVNSLETGLLEEDVAAVAGPYIMGVSAGNVGSADDVGRVADALARVERKVGLPPGRIRLVPWIETALAVQHAYEICAASPRIVAVAFGAEDFATDMGIPRSDDGAEAAYSRSVVCVAARAAGVLALDTPFFGVHDLEGLRREAEAARRFGFRGKFAIHPSHIQDVNEAFSPTSEEIEHARRVVEASDAAEQSGKGATSLDGRVIDAPVVKRARALLETADEISRRTAGP